MSFLAEVVTVAEELAPDAQRVLLRIARRLLAGQEQYGRLNLATDTRHWREEKRQELLDYMIYDCFHEESLLKEEPKE